MPSVFDIARNHAIGIASRVYFNLKFAANSELLHCPQNKLSLSCRRRIICFH